MSDDKVVFDGALTSTTAATVVDTFEAGYVAAMSVARSANDKLVRKSRELVDSVSHDNNGSIVGGQYMGGNGGLYSRETIKAADALRAELSKWGGNV